MEPWKWMVLQKQMKKWKLGKMASYAKKQISSYHHFVNLKISKITMTQLTTLKVENNLNFDLKWSPSIHVYSVFTFCEWLMITTKVINNYIHRSRGSLHGRRSLKSGKPGKDRLPCRLKSRWIVALFIDTAVNNCFCIHHNYRTKMTKNNKNKPQSKWSL